MFDKRITEEEVGKAAIRIIKVDSNLLVKYIDDFKDLSDESSLEDFQTALSEISDVGEALKRIKDNLVFLVDFKNRRGSK